MVPLGPLLFLWNRYGNYIIVVGLALAAIGGLYMKGKHDAQREAERIVLERDAEIRREADSVRRDVDAIGDPTERLRRWERQGP